MSSDASWPAGGAVANWNPSSPKGDGSKERADIMSTEAHDIPENLTADNAQKEYHTGSGKPSGPFGPRGHEF